MRRFAFRRVLPVVQMALFLTLTLLAIQTYRTNQVEYEVATGWDWNSSTTRLHTENFAGELCFALNAPAIAVGALGALLVGGLLVAFFDTTVGFATVGLVIGLLACGGFWYFIGLKLDNLLDLPEPPHASPSTLVQLLTLLAVMALVALSLWAWTWEEGYRPSLRIGRLIVIFWPMFVALALTLKIYGWRRIAKLTTRPA